MDTRQRADLDRHITGNWGEDSVRTAWLHKQVHTCDALLANPTLSDANRALVEHFRKDFQKELDDDKSSCDQCS